MGSEDRTFKANFTSDGIERLRNEVNEKLKELMGNYTDDTLVEYVIVLLRNGRTKGEARNELNVFLGDEDSDLFVTWLWDYLSANLNLYVHSGDSCLNEAKKKTVPSNIGTSQGPQNLEYVPEKDNVERTADKVDEFTENPHTKYAAKTFNLRSEIVQTHLEKIRHKRDQTRKSLSPRPSSHRKRNRLDDRHHSERNVGSVATINPSSRLLQFAVREAVETAGIANKTTEPNSKRLRSVVATTAVDDGRRRLRSMATFSSIAEVALKAAADAAEDVLRVRPSGSVFDRLGRGVDVLDKNEMTIDFSDDIADGDYEFHDIVAVQPKLNQHQVFMDSRGYASDKSMRSSKIELTNHETEIATEIDQDDINDAGAMGYRKISLSQTSTSVSMDDDSATAQQGIPANFYKLKRNYQNQPDAMVHPSYDETINIPASANIWKPHLYMSNKEITGVNSSRVIRGGDGTSGVHLLKENSSVVVAENGKPALFHKTRLQKTPSGAPDSAVNVISLEDADARTVFVSNVHFAATNDSLSRHFNKFGQVLRVTIVTDNATGQPKGSAYIEFMQQEAAEQATSLDGSSFMSRIIKVCRKGSSQPEATTPTAMAWPRSVPHGYPYSVSRFSRVPFLRSSPSSFRGRGIARPGARSLQWKRDAQPMLAEAAGGFTASVPVRSLTYVRPELVKAEAAST